jgi:uncharacterized protein (TIGR03032 family)
MSDDEQKGIAGATASPLRSVHTPSFAALLKQLGVSLVVSTYQAGKLVILRAEDDLVNTHFRAFNKPMGVAAGVRQLAVGTSWNIWEFRNMPDVARKLDPPGRHDGAYLPRAAHVTGDIDVHEMAFAGEELWFVNTRFSCLCTRDADHSFVPRWRPGFVTALAPEDRCHLNGLGMHNDRPKYVTALGETDTAQGWRQNKANGGILVDVSTGEILLRGLSMPHSPRWYADRLWLLESGRGTIAIVDLASRCVEPIAELPGFTRGLDFYGPYAFIGLSQVRDSAVFSGIPITERLTERICGVWVVHIRSGRIVAFLRFEDAVQEIFAVCVLAGIRYPDVVSDDERWIASSYVIPDEALPDVRGRRAA